MPNPNYLIDLSPTELDSLLARLWKYVDPSGDCWEWRAAKCRGGYGVFGISKIRALRPPDWKPKPKYKPPKQPKIQPGDGDSRHGSINGYTAHACRCDECRLASTEYARVYRARKSAA